MFAKAKRETLKMGPRIPLHNLHKRSLTAGGVHTRSTDRSVTEAAPPQRKIPLSLMRRFPLAQFEQSH